LKNLSEVKNSPSSYSLVLCILRVFPFPPTSSSLPDTPIGESVRERMIRKRGTREGVQPMKRRYGIPGLASIIVGSGLLAFGGSQAIAEMEAPAGLRGAIAAVQYESALTAIDHSGVGGDRLPGHSARRVFKQQRRVRLEEAKRSHAISALAPARPERPLSYDRFTKPLVRELWYWPQGERKLVDNKLMMSMHGASLHSDFLPWIALPLENPVTNAIQARVAIIEASLNTRNADQVYAQLTGTFYTTAGSCTPFDQTGDVYVEVNLGDRGQGLEAWWNSYESLNASFSDDIFDTGPIVAPGTLQIGTEYVLKIKYNGSNGFTFSAAGTNVTHTGPTRGTATCNLYTDLAVGEDFIGGSGESFGATITATFDNVKLNNQTTVFDNFNGTNINQSKWSGEQYSSRIQNGMLRMEMGSQLGPGGYWQLSTNVSEAYKDSNYFGATLMLSSESVIPMGAQGRIRIHGYWYNTLFDTGDTPNGYEGTVWAQVALRKNTNGTLKAFAYADVSLDAYYDTWDELLFQNFTKPLLLDTPYVVSIEFDETAKKLIFTFDGEVIEYNITSSIFPVPLYNYKGALVRMQDGPGTAVGYADNIKLGMPSTFSDINARQHLYVQPLADNLVVSGCNVAGDMFCPYQPVTRESLPIGLLKASGAPAPPPATGAVFNDVGASDFAANYIEAFGNAGFTQGCDAGGVNYCPKQVVSHVELAILALRTKFGSGYTPPAATGNVFDDVAASDYGASYIEDFYNRGFGGGCGIKQFCPDQVVNWEDFAGTLHHTFP